MFICTIKHLYLHGFIYPNVIKFWICHCVYHDSADAPGWWLNEIRNISRLLPSCFEWQIYCAKSYLPTSLDGLTYELYYIFLIASSDILRSPPRPPGTPKEPQRHPKGARQVPQGPRRHSQGPSRTPRARNLMKSYVDLIDCRLIISEILLSTVSSWDHILNIP